MKKTSFRADDTALKEVFGPFYRAELAECGIFTLS